MAPFPGRRPTVLLRTALLVLFLLFLVYATFFARWRPHSLAEVKSDLDRFGPAAPFVAVVLIGFGIVVLVPGILLVVAAAILFGYNSIWINLLGEMLGAILAYLIARHFGREPLEAVLGQRLEAFETALGDHAFRTLVLLRLMSFFPGALIVYAPGLVRVPLRQVALASILGDIPFVVLIALLGGSLQDIHGTRDLLQVHFLLPLLFLATLVAVPVVLLARLRRRAQHASRSPTRRAAP